MSLRQAWATLQVKAVNEDQRTITGIATSASTDRMGDVVEPAGAEFNLPIPLLWQHNAREPIGNVIKAKQTPAGWEIVAQLARVDEPGQLKDRLDMAWQSIKAGLVRGLSIGFQSLEESYDKTSGGFHYLRWLWLELSAVTIPANADASIQTIRSLDVGTAGHPVARPQPGVSGASRVSTRTEKTMKKSYADQIAEAVASRKEKTDRIDALLAKASDAGLTLDAAEEESHDALDGEVKALDKHLVRLRAAQEREAAEAVEVKGQKPGLQVQPGQRIAVTRELPKGILFARYAMCQGASRGLEGEAMRLALAHYPDDPGISKLIQAGGVPGGLRGLIERAAVAGGSTTGSHYMDDMIPYNVMNDFIEFLRPGSIIGKFGGPNPGGGPNYPSLNRVGFNERVSGISTGYTAAWRGEGLPALPSAAVTFNQTLLYHNMAALAILTKEAIRFSNPSAEARVRDDLARAVNYKLDLDFVDPAKAAVSTTSPASITNAIVATAPTGTTASKLRTDLATMIALFASNKLDPADIVLIMSAQMALQISMMVNTLGNNDFPEITMKGGSLRGFPVIVSEHLTNVGSPSTQTIIAAKASDIYLADDGVVTVEASDQASLEMQDSSSQSAIAGTGASLVSLWQTGAVGLMATREITWKLRRSTAVQYISPAAYVAS